MVLSASCCIQSRNSSRLPSRRAGSASRAATASVDAPARDDPVAGRDHVVVEPLELLPAPGVGLLEVDGGAEELARRQRVALPPGGLLVATARRQLVSSQRPRSAYAALAAPARCRPARRAARSGASATRLAKKSPLEPSWPVQRRTWPAISAYCRFATTCPAVGLLGQGRAVAGHRRGDAGQPGGDVVPALLGVGGHQVERLADRVRPAADHRDLGAARTPPRPSRRRGRSARGRRRAPPPPARRPGRCARIRSSARRAASSRASKPSGERSGSSWSWPAMPA